jgi:hypothetical protein
MTAARSTTRLQLIETFQYVMALTICSGGDEVNTRP